MNAHQHRYVAKVLRLVALGDIDALEAVIDSADSVEVWNLAQYLDGVAAGLEVADARASAVIGGTIQGGHSGSVVPFPGAPTPNDAIAVGASASLCDNPTCSPDRLCGACADEFGPTAA